ncbi:hypothetical protein JMJ55_01435 [Belnapia sp. T6]|uniref:PrsW family intramembrane metalloprotease n=1 Tax=Belnapia mucosa TaxID=2804532 RepID=A0ABS1UWW3_9PROT|nr:hypothetical protein [Belnapia mucosa]MBL6453963.1 hypothetical protein [Belnapia mucosa]
MAALAWLWRPMLGGMAAYGLAFLGSGVASLALPALGLPARVAGMLWLGLLVPVMSEAAKLLMLRLAGGLLGWASLGASFGLCEAMLRLVHPPPAPIGPLLAGALGAVVLHAALGGLAGAVARRRGRLAPGFALALLLHLLVNLVLLAAVLALSRRFGTGFAEAQGLVLPVLALPLAGIAWRYAAASGAGTGLSPKASASSR